MRSRSYSESSKDGTAEGWGPSAPGHPVINLYLSTFSGHTSTTKGALQGRRRTTWSIKQAHLVQSCSAPFPCQWNCTKLKLEKIENTQKRNPPAKKKEKKKKRNACILQKLQRKHIIAFAGHNIHTDSHMVWCGVCGCTTRLRHFKALQTFSDTIFLEILNVKRQKCCWVSTSKRNWGESAFRKSWQMGNNKQSILLYSGFNDMILWLWES